MAYLNLGSLIVYLNVAVLQKLDKAYKYFL